MLTYGLVLLLLTAIPALFKRTGWFTAQVWLASALTIGGYLQQLLSGNILLSTVGIPGVLILPSLGCSHVSAWFGIIFSLGFPLGSLYARGYMKAHPVQGNASHMFWMSLMFASMHVVLLAVNSLVFMLAWELMSLSSFMAILYDRDNPENVSGALYYLITMQIGAAILLAGFGLMYLRTNSFALHVFWIRGAAKWLLLMGFAFKAGFFPVYSWLPKAHPVAPSHLSGMMSGLMIKTGIFGIIWVMLNSHWQPFEVYILLGISLLTAFNGVIHALSEGHLKRSLAYSSIENIGIIGIAICFWQFGLLLGNPAMATLGFLGALLHSLFHSIFKPLLFYLSGNVLIASHSLNCDELGGLDKTMPRSSRLFLMGTASISALPLFCGFISEFTIFGSIILGFSKSSLAQSISSAITGAILSMVSALALIAFTKLYTIVFSGEPRSHKAARAQEPGIGLLISPAILAALSLCLGIFGWLPLLLMNKMVLILGLNLNAYQGLMQVLQYTSIAFGILLVCFAVIYFVKRRLCKRTAHPTWGCGYQGSAKRMQYTATAYVDPLSYFLKPLMYRKRSLEAPVGYFPKEISYDESIQDYLDHGIIRGASRVLIRFLSYFSGIHNGRTNSYITWLLMALLALLIWTLGAN